MKPTLTRRAAIATALVPLLARASDFPNRPVRLIVPEAPGGAPDIRSRIIAQKLSELWRQQVIVENRPGATGSIGVEAAVRSAPDGYTMVMASISTLTMLPHLVKQPFDPLRDLAFVTAVSIGPALLAAYPGAPFASVDDIVRKSRVSKISCAAGGVGGVLHLAIELFNRIAGAQLVHIPYAGSSQPFTDVVGGQVPLVFNFASALRPFFETKRIKPLAVAGDRRLALLPDVPTFAELGYKGMRVTGWQGIAVPAGVPREMVQVLNAALVKVLQLPDVRESITSTGAEVGGDSPEQFDAFVRAEHAAWGRLIREAGIRIE